MSEGIAQKRAEMSARIDAQREARKNERDLKKAVDLAETADETIRFPHLAQFVESFNAQKRGTAWMVFEPTPSLSPSPQFVEDAPLLC